MDSMGSHDKDGLNLLQREENEDSIYDIYTKKVYYDSSEFGCNLNQNESKKETTIFVPLTSYAHARVSQRHSARSRDLSCSRSPARHRWRLESVRRIRAGTLPRLVESFSDCSTGAIDSAHTNVLLATYRAFCTPHDLMHAVISRYDEIDTDKDMKTDLKTEHKRSIRSVLFIWLKNYPQDMNEPPAYNCLRTLQEFAIRIQYQSLLEKVESRLNVYLGENRLPHHASNADQSEDDVTDEENEIKIDDITARSAMRQVVDNCQKAYRISDSLIRWPIEFENIHETIFAQQLTFIDAALFIKLRPYECLGGQWSSRSRTRQNKSPSVSATVNQFNVVSNRVSAICLKRSLSVYRRAAVISHWILIAQELRVLKNFSSLKAVLSGLQCNAVFRLSHVWDLIDRAKQKMYEELTEIFSDDHNHLMCRQLLMMEGTAKFADPESQNTIRGQTEGHRKNKADYLAKRRKSMFQISNFISGTVPYLGTFLTDLTYLDTAMESKVNGLINFEKRRKEFEILAQIILLQSSAHSYNIQLDTVFHDWFLLQRVYDDRELHELSCIIEPEQAKTPRLHKKKSSISSLNIFSPKRLANSPSNVSLSSQVVGTPDSNSSDNGSIQSSNWFDTFNGLKLSRSMSNVASLLHHTLPRSDNDSVQSAPPYTQRSSDSYVVKVVLQAGESRAGNLYKSIMVSNQDRTSDVIQKILDKFEVVADIKDFIVFQVNGDKEIRLSDKGNIYYAIDSSIAELKFIMKKRSKSENKK